MFKKCDVHIAENYRPVSLISVTCKLLEHICKHILTYLENNNIQNNLNYDFCSIYPKACETQLRVTLNDLLHFNDEGSQTDVIILVFPRLLMGMVVIQPYILVSKLKKIKTKFLRCTGYLNSIKNPIKQDLLQILVLVQQQNFLNC